MKLFIKDRLEIELNLQQRRLETYVEKAAKRDILAKLQLEQSEMDAVNFRSTPVDGKPGVTRNEWNASLDQGKDIEFTKREWQYLGTVGALLDGMLDEYETALGIKKEPGGQNE